MIFQKLLQQKLKYFNDKPTLLLSHYKITQHRETIIDFADKGREQLSFETIYVWVDWKIAMQEGKNKSVLMLM